MDSINYLALGLNGTGQLGSAQELEEAVTDDDINFDDGLTQKELEKIDKDGDGIITEAEFKASFNGSAAQAQTYWSAYQSFYQNAIKNNNSGTDEQNGSSSTGATSTTTTQSTATPKTNLEKAKEAIESLVKQLKSITAEKAEEILQQITNTIEQYGLNSSEKSECLKMALNALAVSRFNTQTEYAKRYRGRETGSDGSNIKAEGQQKDEEYAQVMQKYQDMINKLDEKAKSETPSTQSSTNSSSSTSGTGEQTGSSSIGATSTTTTQSTATPKTNLEKAKEAIDALVKQLKSITAEKAEEILQQITNTIEQYGLNSSEKSECLKMALNALAVSRFNTQTEYSKRYRGRETGSDGADIKAEGQQKDEEYAQVMQKYQDMINELDEKAKSETPSTQSSSNSSSSTSGTGEQNGSSSTGATSTTTPQAETEKTNLDKAKEALAPILEELRGTNINDIGTIQDKFTTLLGQYNLTNAEKAECIKLLINSLSISRLETYTDYTNQYRMRAFGVDGSSIKEERKNVDDQYGAKIDEFEKMLSELNEE